MCTLGAQSPLHAEGSVQAGSGEGTDGKGRGAVGTDLLQGLQEPDPGDRAGDRDGSSSASVFPSFGPSGEHSLARDFVSLPG